MVSFWVALSFIATLSSVEAFAPGGLGVRKTSSVEVSMNSQFIDAYEWNHLSLSLED